MEHRQFPRQMGILKATYDLISFEEKLDISQFKLFLVRSERHFSDLLKGICEPQMEYLNVEAKKNKNVFHRYSKAVVELLEAKTIIANTNC